MQEIEFEEIKKLVESCHLNFLIGSGASMPFLKTLNQIENLLSDLESVKKANRENAKICLIEASIKQDYFSKSIEGSLKLLSTLNKMDKESDLVKTVKNYKIFLMSLHTILSKRRSNLVNKQVNIFTTNLDILIEYTLEDINAIYNDGFNGKLNPTFSTENFHNSIRKTSTHYDYESEVPLFNIFKLHGSVNWKLIDNTINYDYSLKTLRNAQKSKLNNSALIKIDSVDEMYKRIQANNFDETPYNTFLDNFDKLVMINPTKGKFETTTKDLTFYELLRMYSNHLEKTNSVLFVIGFSFADEHIREITKRVAKSNPTLLIVVFAYNKKSKDDISNNLNDYSNIKYIWSDNELFSLDKINEKYFQKISNELTGIITKNTENKDTINHDIIPLSGKENDSK